MFINLFKLIFGQKRSVFEFNKKYPDLSNATGYLQPIISTIQQKLNFSADLVVTSGFGSPGSNGSWNGMVGVLSRNVSFQSSI